MFHTHRADHLLRRLKLLIHDGELAPEGLYNCLKLFLCRVDLLQLALHLGADAAKAGDAVGLHLLANPSQPGFRRDSACLDRGLRFLWT